MTSGIYTFYTTDSLDTVGMLYDSDKVLLTSNDDSDFDNANYNFELSHNLIAGKTYYIRVSEYASGTGSYTLHSSFKSGINLSAILYLLM
jgi:hypothetical protein